MKQLKMFFVTGVEHGSVVFATNKFKAQRIFKRVYNEKIINIKRGYLCP
jgi:hypothetical protein